MPDRWASKHRDSVNSIICYSACGDNNYFLYLVHPFQEARPRFRRYSYSSSLSVPSFTFPVICSPHASSLHPMLSPQAYVFMVGGGNYIEYQNLQDYCRRQGTRQITYGTSELMNARRFLAQVGIVGQWWHCCCYWYFYKICMWPMERWLVKMSKHNESNWTFTKFDWTCCSISDVSNCLESFSIYL